MKVVRMFNLKFISCFLSVSILSACQATGDGVTSLPAVAGKSSGPGGSLVCGCGGDCTSTAGDGIPDTWKTIGIDSNCTGTVDLDLGAMGASPNHKDVFLQLDYMTVSAQDLGLDPNATYKPSAGAIEYLVQAFNIAPVSNPDGTNGIHLHVIVGNEVPYHEVVTLDPNASSSCAFAGASHFR